MSNLDFNEKVYFFVRFILEIVLFSFIAIISYFFLLFFIIGIIFNLINITDIPIIEWLVNLKNESIYGLVVIIVLLFIVLKVFFYYAYIFPLISIFVRIKNLKKIINKKYNILNVSLIKKHIRKGAKNLFYFIYFLVENKTYSIEIKSGQYFKLKEGDNIRIISFGEKEEDFYLIDKISFDFL